MCTFKIGLFKQATIKHPPPSFRATTLEKSHKLSAVRGHGTSLCQRMRTISPLLSLDALPPQAAMFSSWLEMQLGNR